ncbi:MAG TPA: 50S ribosomal protein L11 methyltransferase [Firmicutes bacterium]|nr:50S ribosomal protein L11 methyltransferase [Bacillota bacterium]
MQWLEVTVKTRQESIEAVAAKMQELGAGGVAIEENWNFAGMKALGLGDYFPRSSGLAGDEALIRGYFPVSFYEDGRQELENFLARLPDFGLAPGRMTVRMVTDAGWEHAWKKYWKPVPVGKKLLIVPAWQRPPAVEGRLILLLDPGAAFGSGTHESTRLCLEWLEEKIQGGEAVLDLGCGSGILALAAGLLGAGRVMGADNDVQALQASRENAALNGLAAVFVRVDLLADEVWAEFFTADIVTANLTADLHLSVLGRLKRVLAPGGQAVLSGIVRGRQDEVEAAAARCGFLVREKLCAGEWVALGLELKK